MKVYDTDEDAVAAAARKRLWAKVFVSFVAFAISSVFFLVLWRL